MWLTGLIKLAEIAIRGRHKGDLKKRTVMAGWAAMQTFLAQEGELPAAVPNDEVSKEIDKTHAQLVKTGEINDLSAAYGMLVLGPQDVIEFIKAVKTT